MFKAKKLAGLLEARVNESGSQGKGRARFVNEIHAMLGLKRQVGEGASAAFVESVDTLGRPTLGENRCRPEEFSLRQLAEGIGGRDWVEEYFDPNGGPDMQTLLEAGPGIDPTAMLNINTFSLSVAGLVEAKILEKFQNPAFIGDELVEVRPTRMNGEKLIGVTGIGDKAQSRKPGEPHPRAGFGEHYVTTPELDEKALAVEVQQEAVFYDLTGQVLDVAGSVGEELGYLREKTIIDLALGVTNSYVYNGTAYDTYQATTPWINSHSNPMSDHQDIDDSEQLFAQMTDPATGKEILVIPNTLLIAPTRRNDFKRVLNATEVRETTNTNTITISPNPLEQRFKVLSSPIAFNRCTNAAGLNLSAANAAARWYMGDPKKAFRWMEAWPIRVRQASASEYVMLDRGLIAAYFGNYRGIGAVAEPRYMVCNTH